MSFALLYEQDGVVYARTESRPAGVPEKMRTGLVHQGRGYVSGAVPASYVEQELELGSASMLERVLASLPSMDAAALGDERFLGVACVVADLRDRVLAVLRALPAERRARLELAVAFNYRIARGARFLDFPSEHREPSPDRVLDAYFEREAGDAGCLCYFRFEDKPPPRARALIAKEPSRWRVQAYRHRSAPAPIDSVRAGAILAELVARGLVPAWASRHWAIDQCPDGDTAITWFTPTATMSIDDHDVGFVVLGAEQALKVARHVLGGAFDYEIVPGLCDRFTVGEPEQRRDVNEVHVYAAHGSYVLLADGSREGAIATVGLINDLCRDLGDDRRMFFTVPDEGRVTAYMAPLLVLREAVRDGLLHIADLDALAAYPVRPPEPTFDH